MAIVQQKETAAAPAPVPPPAPARELEARQQAPVRREKKVAAGPPAAPAVAAQESPAVTPPAPPALGKIAEAPKAESVRADAAPQAMFERPAAEPMRAEAMADTAVSARGMFLGAAQQSMRLRQAAASESAAPPLGLRYTVVRDDSGVKVRITANVNGYLSVGGATPVALTAMAPYTTPAISGDEVRVVFARQPLTSVAAPAGAVTEVAGEETYVVSARGAPLAVTIRLTPR
jgi:hypothetical protein